MTMLITRFNKMIRNKTLWWFFAIIVSVSFIAVYSGTSDSGGCSDTTPIGVGKIFDRDVTPSELDQAMTFAMRMRNYRSQSEKNIRLIRQEGWKRLALLENAKRAGISASLEEMMASIQHDRNFQVDGAFNKDRYRAIVESQIPGPDPSRTYEEFLRQEIILQKFASILESCVWTAPSELNQRLTRITDLFTIQYAVLKFDTNATPVTVLNDDAKKYFEKNSEKFRIPEKISVRFISFPISNYLARVNVTDDEALKHYTNHMENYTTSDTNMPTAKPFDEVKLEIITALKQQKATREAEDAAARFTVSLIPDRKGKAPTFEDVAKKSELEVLVSPFFSLREDVPGINVDRDFNRTAFGLDPDDPERYFSDPVTGNDAVYVIATKERKASHLPLFDDVAEKAMASARSEAQEEAFKKKCNTARDVTIKAVKEGKSFKETMKGFGAEVGTNMTFSAYDAASAPFEYFDIILPKIMSLSKDDVSDALETDDGMIIVHVADKKPGDPGAASMLKPEMISAIDRSLTAAVFEDYKSYNLAKAGFVDKTSASATDDDEDIPEEAPAAPTDL